MFGALATAGLIAAAVTVQGATTCPTPEAVELRLRPLLASAPGSPTQVRLDREGPALHIALHAPDGALTARRTIEGPHSCESLAEAAAVIVAAWHSEVAARPLLAADPAAPDAGLHLAAAAPPLSPAPASWGLSAAGGVSFAGGMLAAAAGLSVTHAPLPDRSWAARLGLVYQGPRDSELLGGKLRWQRWLVELGPQLQGGGGPLGWELHLGAALGLTRLQGRGLSDARDQRDLGLGLSSGARLAIGQNGLRPFLELSGRAWPTGIVAYEGSSGAEVALPRFEALLTLGAAIGR